jgi:hypothetical protein
LYAWNGAFRAMITGANCAIDAHPLSDIDGQDAVGDYGAVY